MHKINTKLRIPLILSPRVFNSSWIIISTHQKRINKHICLHIFFTFITWKEKEEVTCSFSYLPSHNSHGFGITYLSLSLFMSKQLFNDDNTKHYANATGKENYLIVASLIDMFTRNLAIFVWFSHSRKSCFMRLRDDSCESVFSMFRLNSKTMCSI